MSHATTIQGARSRPPVARHARGDEASSALTLEHADRWTWRPWIDPARCRHAVAAFFVGTPQHLRKLCGGCGAVLADDLPRCPAMSKKRNRQCRLPVRADRGYSTCAAHRCSDG